MTKKGDEIRGFILDNVIAHPKDIARISASHFGISRPAVANHLRILLDRGLLVAEGVTKARKYKLKPISQESFRVTVTPKLEEHILWREKVFPLLEGVKENVLAICSHGFNEMFNNVIEHSDSDSALFSLTQTAVNIEIFVRDFGVGIFEKIKSHFGLDDPRHALLELSKGKLSSEEDRHSGEGIFFTSRMFDIFSIRSGNLFYNRFKQEGDWLIEVKEQKFLSGTGILMGISKGAEQTVKEIFDQYSPDSGEFGFTKTHVPIELLRYEGEQLVSRSQARRLLIRFDRFQEVLLDFRGITTIGQAFADEIFRVFRNEHPDITIRWMNSSEDIQNVIRRVSQIKLKYW